MLVKAFLLCIFLSHTYMKGKVVKGGKDLNQLVTLNTGSAGRQ